MFHIVVNPVAGHGRAVDCKSNPEKRTESIAESETSRYGTCRPTIDSSRRAVQDLDNHGSQTCRRHRAKYPGGDFVFGTPGDASEADSGWRGWDCS